MDELEETIEDLARYKIRCEQLEDELKETMSEQRMVVFSFMVIIILIVLFG